MLNFTSGAYGSYWHDKTRSAQADCEAVHKHMLSNWCLRTNEELVSLEQTYGPIPTSIIRCFLPYYHIIGTTIAQANISSTDHNYPYIIWFESFGCGQAIHLHVVLLLYWLQCLNSRSLGSVTEWFLPIYCRSLLANQSMTEKCSKFCSQYL